MGSTRIQSNRCRGNIPDVTLNQTSGNYIRYANGNGAQQNSITVHDGHIHANVRCYSYNQFDHFKRNLPDENQGEQLMQYILRFTHQAVDRGEIIKPDCLILDYCTTIILVRNQYLLQSLKSCTPNDKFCVYKNCGYLDYYWIGTLKYIPLDIIYNPLSI